MPVSPAPAGSLGRHTLLFAALVTFLVPLLFAAYTFTSPLGVLMPALG